MHARNRLGCLVAVAATVLLARAPAAPSRDPLVLPPVTEVLPASYDAVWDATVLSLGHLVNPAAMDKTKGLLETDLFFFSFPAGTEATQNLLLKLAVTLRRADARRTAVEVRPSVVSMTLDGILPGPTNNPWADFFARLRTNVRGRF
jgi:hypothetical protein